jgi:hypothetical protein
MLLSEGQMSDYDYKGAALMIDALPPARQLLGDKGYDARPGALRPASHRTAQSRSNMTAFSIAHGTRSKMRSADSRIGGASTPAATDAHIHSCLPSASQQLSSFWL